MLSDKNRLIPTQDPPEDGAPGWLTSYSDMMTDLLAIFVILFSFAMVSRPVVVSRAAARQNTASAASVAAEVRQSASSAAEAAVRPSSAGPAVSSSRPADEKFNSLYESIRAYIRRSGLSDRLSVSKEGDRLILIRVSDSVLFNSGKADINPAAEQLLGRISDIFTAHAGDIEGIRIEGHTDDRPIKNEQFDSNWELSTSRAVNVLRWLAGRSPLGPEKFSAVGYGEFHPIADNGTAENRAKNRRVDFLIETEDE